MAEEIDWETLWTDEATHAWDVRLVLVQRPTPSFKGIWRIAHCKSTRTPGVVLDPKLAEECFGVEWERMQELADESLGRIE